MGWRPSPLLAQQAETPVLGLFETITLAPGFTPKTITMRGVSGGNTVANQLVKKKDTPTGPCVGFIDQQADHTIILEQGFPELSLWVESPGDITLVIQGPGGTWCNDDHSGTKSAGISGQWLQGTYEMWVGSYQKGEYHPYKILIREIQPSQ